jgi:iron complex outermembrane recepter protein
VKSKSFTGSKGASPELPFAKLSRAERRRFLRASITLILAGSTTVYAGRAQGQAAISSVNDKDSLGEITVTAQRRTQSVQDIPYNISVIGAADLERSGTTGINGLAHLVPGLTNVDAGPAARGNTNDLTLRGLRTDGPGGAGNNGTDIPAQTVNSVSTYFGETPVFFPIALHDIDRIEVLRGPQGTLYGSGAEAGTIRFIPKRPTFDAFGGEFSASGGVTERAGGKSNGSVDGVLNVPFSSQVALRIVAGDEHLAGFINQVDLWQRQGNGLYAAPTPSIPGNPTSGPVIAPVRRGTNSSNQTYARAALRWDPTDGWDLQLDYLHQHTAVDDVQTSNPTYPGGVVDLGSAGGFANSAFVTRPGGTYDATNALLQPYEDTVDLVSAVGSVDLGLATFTSATSFYRDKSYAVSDVTGNFFVPGGTNFLALPYYTNYPRSFAVEATPVSENSFTQELRLVSKQGQAVDYVAGLFYRNQRVNSDTHQVLPGITAYRNQIGAPQPYQGLPDLAYQYDRDTRFIDKAIFGELTAHPTANWQVTGGARFFQQSFGDTTLQRLPICSSICAADGVDPTGLSTAHISTQDNNHVFKLNTSFDLTSYTKIYGTYSQGFRRGGANALPTTGAYASLPAYQTFKPDFAKNYEVGIKGTAFEQRIRFSADVFLIHLSNFQFGFSTLSGIPATFNGDKAQSKGAELELQARITNRLTATLGYTYTDASVTDPIKLYDLGFCGQPVCLLTALPAGARLPGVPKNTATGGIDYQVPLPVVDSDGWSLNFHVDASFRGAAGAVIDPTSRSYWVIPSSTLANGTVTLFAPSHMSYDLFVNNATNSPGYSGGRGTAQDPATLLPLPNLFATRVVTRPRTFGIRIHYSF